MHVLPWSSANLSAPNTSAPSTTVLHLGPSAPVMAKHALQQVAGVAHIIHSPHLLFTLGPPTPSPQRP